jgi:spore maturation protein CgeB
MIQEPASRSPRTMDIDHLHEGRAEQSLDIVIIGLSITSAWGNGHATTYRALVKALAARGHHVTFYERDVPWYAAHRDLPEPPWGRTVLYDSVEELRSAFPQSVGADLVMLGSYVPEAPSIARWLQQTAHGVVAFYDIDTPVTLAALDRGECDYLTPILIPGFDLYLSFAGGPALERLHAEFSAPLVRPLYCSVDPDQYAPDASVSSDALLGYLGTYSTDRQAKVDALLIEPARALPDARFVVAGAQYPPSVEWPANVRHEEHCPPSAHSAFYASQQWTLNVTRADMVANGWSPSVRLFEAAACGTPIISDWWAGLDHFLTPGREVLIAESTEEMLRLLRETPEATREAIANRARRRVLAAHTNRHRALELEQYVHEARMVRAPGLARTTTART